LSGCILVTFAVGSEFGVYMCHLGVRAFMLLLPLVLRDIFR